MSRSSATKSTAARTPALVSRWMIPAFHSNQPATVTIAFIRTASAASQACSRLIRPGSGSFDGLSISCVTPSVVVTR